MQLPRGFSIVVGVIFGLAVVGVVMSAVLLFRGTTPEPATANVNGALMLSCTSDADCASYCGTDACYTPVCATSTIGSAGSCTCRSTCGPVSTTNANANTNTSVRISSFTECVAAGYAVMESHPRKCAAGGVLFTEVLTNANTNVNAALNTNVTELE